MAIQTYIVTPTHEILPDAYLKIQKITTSNTDYEYFESVNDESDISEKLSWCTKITSDAVIYIWADEIARKNRAAVKHWFIFTFDYDLQIEKNIYQQCYEALSKNFNEYKDV